MEMATYRSLWGVVALAWASTLGVHAAAAQPAAESLYKVERSWPP